MVLQKRLCLAVLFLQRWNSKFRFITTRSCLFGEWEKGNPFFFFFFLFATLQENICHLHLCNLREIRGFWEKELVKLLTCEDEEDGKHSVCFSKMSFNGKGERERKKSKRCFCSNLLLALGKQWSLVVPVFPTIVNSLRTHVWNYFFFFEICERKEEKARWQQVNRYGQTNSFMNNTFGKMWLPGFSSPK